MAPPLVGERQRRWTRWNGRSPIGEFARKADWPAWWDWELELSSHLLNMVDRLLVVVTAYPTDER
jgi:hypothetical protein